MNKQQTRKSALWTALVGCAALTFGLSAAAFAAHPDVPLLDYNGTAIVEGAADITETVDVTESTAFSMAETCGACHDYDGIEKHSYHSQLGANEWKGWNGYNPDSADGYKSGPSQKGKAWVQSPGHAGKW